MRKMINSCSRSVLKCPPDLSLSHALLQYVPYTWTQYELVQLNCTYSIC